MTKNSWAATGAIVVVALAAAYPASAWYFGKRIEVAHGELDKQIAAVPYLKLVKQDFERQLFGSTEVITLELPAEFFHTPPAPVVPEAPAADVNATANMYGGGSTALGLLVTSDHPARAGVTGDVRKVLEDAGAKGE